MSDERVAVADRSGGIRILEFAHPPLNAISFALSALLAQAVTAAEADPQVRAVVVVGAGGTFSAGADITDFATEPQAGAVTVRDVVAAVERSSKTFVAAIDGAALGGGFELALACDYRVSSERAKLGLPEIKLGLLPGAGGTQRLPRLIGAQAALQLMLTGESIGARDALGRGILDEVAGGDVVEAALALTARVVDTEPKRRVSARPVALGVAGVNRLATPFVVAQAHRALPPEERGGFAAHKLVDAVAASLELDFARGMVREARLFDELVRSQPSLALRHLFFAERETANVPGVAAAAPLEVQAVGVVGAGTMGTGIAIAFANAGIPVTIVEPDDAAVARSKQTVFGMFAHAVRRGRLTQEEAWNRGRSIAWEHELGELANADLVVEAVIEDLGVKRSVFAELDAVCRPTAILASNTSTLDIDAFAAATRRPDRVLGLHFFAPANIMKLLEIVRGTQTSAQTLRTALGLAKRLRKIAVVSANAFGFIGNRMFFDYAREAIGLLEDGIAPERVDRVMTQTFGFALGPFATFDLSGVDVLWHVTQSGAAVLGAPRTQILERMYAAKRWGQKTGRGFFAYDAAAPREPVPDPALVALAAEAAAAAGIAPREVGDREIVERLTFALVNAGAGLLEREVALRPEDEDIVCVYGYGFPPDRGGPMWYADAVGIATVVERIAAFGWPVSPLLARIAREGGTLASERREFAHA